MGSAFNEETREIALENQQLIGCYVGEESTYKNGSTKVLLGKVVSYDATKKLYLIFYENGDREVMDREHLTKILMLNHKTVSYYRKRKLENLVTIISGNGNKRPATRSRNNAEQQSSASSEDVDDAQLAAKRSRKNCNTSEESGASEDVNDARPIAKKVEKMSLPEQSASEDGNDGEESDYGSDVDSSSDSCDNVQNMDLSPPQQLPVVALPPSSGDIDIPEDSVPYLFSVYNFLRSFSVQLFLSPFGLYDFVGCLNCTVQNTLLDAVHLSLMQALRRHLQSISSEEETNLAYKCLRHSDWSLLDPLTWPTILVGYLYVMGYTKHLGQKFCYLVMGGGEYYGMPVDLKLKVLQILCDDIVDSEEIKTELGTREDMEEDEEELGINSNRDPLESGPKRVHPRNSKTSACKNREALESSVEPKTISNSKASIQDADASAGVEDGNSDECRLCGMDGMLLCCDGCPSAYHSRCIGLMKQFLPDGPWYCPECSVNKLGTTSSRVGRGTSGAEIFGSDANGRMFIGTCNYLLVVGTQFNAESVVSYYNSDDIVKVIKAILATESASAYADICKGISKYWEVPLPLIDMQHGNPGSALCPLVDKENGPSLTQCSAASVVNDATKTEINSGCALESLNKPNISDVLTEDHDLSITSYPVKDKKCEQGTGGNLSNGSVFTELETATCGSINDNISACKEGAGSFNNILSKKESISTLSNNVKKHQTFFKPQIYTNQYAQGDIAASAAANLVVLAANESKISEPLNKSSNQNKKTLAADTALQMKAFSGVTLNFLWPAPDKKLFDIPRERCGWCISCRAQTTWKRGCLLNLAAANAVKRFARNANSSISLVKQAESQVQLLIVGTQIAHMEESLRGLIAGPLSDVHYNKQWHKLAREASTCRALKLMLLELEKSIHLIAFCGDWTKPIDDWLTELSSFSSSSSSLANGMSQTGTASKKRGNGRKSRKKQFGASEFEDDSSNDNSKNMFWWRGGKLSKALYQKGTLHSSLIRKASRQGGRRRISGIQYPEGPELPRKSHQFAWRASVEMSQNVSQLALQVRYLDAHLRWKDLVRPEQSLIDSKGSDVDAMPFRNAVICDKRTTANKIQYALTFSVQKHLPVRVTKNILETEKLQDGNEKMWFLENHVPLYLIKEYEEKIGLTPIPTSTILRSQNLVRLQKRKLKDWGNILSYLERMGMEPSSSCCASCKQDVILRDSVRCNTCQGYVHKDCTVASISVQGGGNAFLFKCNSCSAKPATPISVSKETPNTSLKELSHQRCLVQTQPQTSFKVSLNTSLKGLSQQQRYLVQSQSQTSFKCTPQTKLLKPAVGVSPVTKSSVSGSTSVACNTKRLGQSSIYGLIWKRKNGDVTGTDFRMRNILLKGKDGTYPNANITCSYCNKPYHPELMYIRCEVCEKWYHADAVELEEAQIFDLVGFKCCRCRRKTLPKCPYADSNYMEAINAKRSEKILVEPMKLDDSMKIEDFAIADDDPLLHSCGKVEPVGVQSFDTILSTKPQQKKLSIRRPSLANGNNNMAYTTQNGNSECIEVLYDSRQPVDWESNIVNNAQLEGDDTLVDGYYGNAAPDNTDITVSQSINEMEYEPQTYFSFTELLASDDHHHHQALDNNNQFDVSIDNSSDWPSIDFDDFLPWDSAAGACDNGLASNYDYNFSNNNNEFGVVSNDEVPCDKCKLNVPSPDLVCEVCKMRIHSHCSPWEDCEEMQWRCGSCRDWK